MSKCFELSGKGLQASEHQWLQSQEGMTTSMRLLKRKCQNLGGIDKNMPYGDEYKCEQVSMEKFELAHAMITPNFPFGPSL